MTAGGKSELYCMFAVVGGAIVLMCSTAYIQYMGVTEDSPIVAIAFTITMSAMLVLYMKSLPGGGKA